jgi:dipeptidyl aminopeptidase/acylaminoacyl peptidase
MYDIFTDYEDIGENLMAAIRLSFGKTSILFVVLWILLPIAVQAQPADARASFSTLDFVMPEAFDLVTLSPNGQYLAFTNVKIDKFCLGRGGQIIPREKSRCKDKWKRYRKIHRIIIIDLESDKILRSELLPDLLQVNWLDWANDNRLLAEIYIPTTLGSNGYYWSLGGSRILSIPRSGGPPTTLFEGQRRATRLFGTRGRVTNPLRNDPAHVILPNYNNSGRLDLWKVNVESGVASRIAIAMGGTFYWFTSPNGKPVLRFDCAGRYCLTIKVFAYVGPDKSEVALKDWKLIKSFRLKFDAGLQDFEFWPISATTKDGQFYVLSNDENDERRTIKVYDITTEKYIETIFEHPQMDVSGAIIDLQTGEYVGASYYEDRMNASYVNGELQTHYDLLNEAFDNKENISFLGFSQDKKRAVVKVSGTNNPGEYYIYDLLSHELMLIMGIKPALGRRLPSSADIINFTARDGFNLTAYHHYPEGGTGPATPLIVMPHGGPEARDYFDYDKWVQFFVNRGYQVLQVNFRGSYGYGRSFAKAGYGQWGSVMQNDVIDAVKLLYANGSAAPQNACMVGYSYGGYVSLYAGATTPELFNCFVSGAGPSDLNEDLNMTRREYGIDSETYLYWQKSIGDPKQDAEKLKATSPVNLASKFEDPVLLIHGDEDYNVDIKHSKRMYQQLKRNDKQVEFVILKGEDHGGWEIESEIFFLETIDSFLQKYLSFPESANSQ